MKIEELELLGRGTRVIFHSSSKNERRRSLNGRLCMIYVDDDEFPQGWVRTSSEAGYPHDVAVCLQFMDTWAKTWAAVDEFEILIDHPKQE